MESRFNDLKLAERGARLSIIAYIILSLFKLSMGFIAHSKALTADGLNNTTDIIASLAILIGLRIARKPADEDHPYGHLRAETISSLVASLIMIAVGLNVLYNAAISTIFFEAKAPDLLAAATALVCAVGIYFVYRYNKKIALKINNSALMAAAKDNLSDAWVSIGAATGIIASQFGLPWIDPLAALIVGCLIIKTGWDIFAEATHNLTDGFEPEKLVDLSVCIEQVDGVNRVRDIKARIHGNHILIDIIILVSPELTISQGHDITDAIELKLRSDHNITESIIHVEPDDAQL